MLLFSYILKNRLNNMKVTSYRLPDKLLKAMKKKAESEYRSVNAMVEMVLTNHCKKEMDDAKT
jgi:hypothetical protein